MIKCKQLTKRFGEFAALNSVDLSVQTGSIFGLVGSNGAGKSTLLRTLAGVYRPDGGEATVNSQQVFENREIKSKLRFVPDELRLPPGCTLLSMGRQLSGLYPAWDEAWFTELCMRFPVNEKARFQTLSKGNKRQAGLILALASRPEVLLLDEIFDGIDPVVRKLVKQLIAQEVADRQMTVVLASHNLREMEDFCDTLALLHKGGLILEKELDELSLHLQRVQAVFTQAPPIEQLKQRLCITTFEQTGSLITFVARGTREDVLKTLDEFEPTFKETVPLSLEEVFISEMEAAGYNIDKILG